MEEIWRDIAGFEGIYQVSNLGRIKSFQEWKRASCPKEFILKSTLANNGYCQVTLYKDTKRKKYLVHRLVAEAFIPNPDGLPHINHKDENPENNNADNLEWCTPLYNNRYGTARYRAMMTKGRRVDQCLINGQWIATYINPTIASEITGIKQKAIVTCASGHIQSGEGFIWKWAD